MKRALFSFLFLALAARLSADEPTYRASLDSMHERFRTLEVERNDYRKVKPGLPPDREAERLRLLGQLVNDDPVWALAEQIQADLTALAAVRPQTPADLAIMENLKDFLAITIGCEERATTYAQAQDIANLLRQFIARRDVNGASTWARSL